jgi:outer membrane protein OmpA-like peptidoglycan-associated protein
MMSRQGLRYLGSLCILSIFGIFAVGCTFEDPPSLTQLYSARDAVSGAQKAGADERYPDEYADLENRYLMARGTFYACQEDKAGEMAQALIADANALATKKPEVTMAPQPAMPANQGPVASLEGPTEAMATQLLTFDASTSSDPDDDTLKYKWDFGDGTTSNFTFPIATHRYTEPGVYTVSLMVDDGKGGEAAAQQQVVVLESAEPRELTILFVFNGYRLTDLDHGRLDQVVQDMQQDPQLTATVVGHTDSQGPESFNQQLGMQRAQMVADYLTSQGIAADRLTLDSRGETEPAAPNGTREGRQANRRAVVIW